MQYEILEHIGDVKIRVSGETKEELFQAAAAGMFAMLKPKRRGNPSGVREIKIQSLDFNALLVDFLNELNYLRQVHRETYDRIEIKSFSDTELKAKLFGYEAEEFGEDIKAVTFHDLNIHQNKEGSWETFIVFDV